MKNPFRTQFDTEIDRVIEIMSKMNPALKEYKDVAEAVKLLSEARSKKNAFPLDPDVLVSAGLNLIGVILILQYENLHVVTSRAMNYLKK